MFDFNTGIAAKDITPAIICKWEDKYGEDLCRDDFEGKTAFFKMPSQKEVVEAMKKHLKQQPAATQNDCVIIILKKAWLGGDTELLTNEKYLERMRLICQM